MNGLVIGKRVTVGQIVMGVLTIFAFAWDAFNPDNKVPAGQIMVISQAITGVVQIWVANKFGVTPPKG